MKDGLPVVSTTSNRTFNPPCTKVGINIVPVEGGKKTVRQHAQTGLSGYKTLPSVCMF